MMDFRKLHPIKIFDYLTPNEIINQRIFKHFIDLSTMTDFKKDETAHFIHILLLISKKLVSVWKHLELYRTTEKDLIDRFTAGIKPDEHLPSQFEHSQDLFIEFDEFLVQVKSTLDYLVKIPIPIVGKACWNLTTFGNKGEVVIKALKNFPKTRKKQAENVITHVLDKNKQWLQDTITARDRINHYLDGGIPFQNFSIFWDTSKPLAKIHVPLWADSQSIREFMAIVWDNFFRLVEDFIAMFLFMRANPNLYFVHGISEIDSPISPWVFVPKEKMEKEIKKPGWKLVDKKEDN